MMDILDHPAHATVAVASSFSVATFDLPFWINVATAIYLAMLITHKGWQMYKEWNAPSK